ALAGVQAQILPASLLALWNRCAAGAGTAAELTARLFDARTLLRLWGQRHTLHLYATADWGLIQAAFAGRRTWWERQALAEDSPLDPAAFREGIARAAELLRARGTLSRKELRASGVPMPPELFSPWGGVFAELVRIGEACHARWEGGEARYAHREHWLPGTAWNPPSSDEANAELARRYFACYGPASAQDFAYWRAGSLVGESRRALEAVAGEVAEVEAAGGRGGRLYVRRADLDELFAPPPEPEAWPVRTLGRFDPLLLAHRDKDWVVPEKYYDRVWRPAGHIEAVVLAHGRAVATWRYDRIGAGTLAVRVFPFKGALPRHVGKALRHQAKEVARFFGLKPVPVRVEPAGAVPPPTRSSPE
ncbi:MAG: AlkZ family DNA glycosylase, partial [Gluconacetobacter diazotrophicus]|nr:AlkZ family DNA glycosylase [Gluconacetobacter diazotrophicus]